MYASSQWLWQIPRTTDEFSGVFDCLSRQVLNVYNSLWVFEGGCWRDYSDFEVVCIEHWLTPPHPFELSVWMEKYTQKYLLLVDKRCVAHFPPSPYPCCTTAALGLGALNWNWLGGAHPVICSRDRKHLSKWCCLGYGSLVWRDMYYLWIQLIMQTYI